jgi:hypothetical protein
MVMQICSPKQLVIYSLLTTRAGVCADVGLVLFTLCLSMLQLLEKESLLVLRITRANMNQANADLGRRDLGTFERLQNMSRCFQFYVFDTFEHHT